MSELKILKNEVSIDYTGAVVIKNEELKKRVEDFFKNPHALAGEEMDGLLDNCDCKCGVE